MGFHIFKVRTLLWNLVYPIVYLWLVSITNEIKLEICYEVSIFRASNTCQSTSHLPLPEKMLIWEGVMHRLGTFLFPVYIYELPWVSMCVITITEMFESYSVKRMPASYERYSGKISNCIFMTGKYNS